MFPEHTATEFSTTVQGLEPCVKPMKNGRAWALGLNNWFDPYFRNVAKSCYQLDGSTNKSKIVSEQLIDNRDKNFQISVGICNL